MIQVIRRKRTKPKFPRPLLYYLLVLALLIAMICISKNIPHCTDDSRIPMVCV